MKKIFVMAALTMAAISCTKSDVLDSPVLDQEISFRTYLGKAPVSKATIQDETSVKTAGYSFTVKAIKHWPGENSTFTVESNLEKQEYMDRSLSYVANTGEGAAGGSWKYDGTPVYWPTDGSSLRFVAFGNNVTSNSFVQQEGSNTAYKYTVSDNLSEQQDLIVANTAVMGIEPDKDPEAVVLNFKHMLSRIGFSLSSNATTDVHITELKLNGVNKFYNEATIDLLGETLALTPVTTGEGGTTSYSVITSKSTFTPSTSTNVPIIQTPAEAVVANRYLMIIPQGAPVGGEGMTITGTFTIGEDTTPRPINIELKDVTALANGFEAGKAYEFIMNVKTYQISFDVTVDEWDPVTGDDFTQTI